ncbi:hypothetical protein ABIE30_004564, partial [Janthinobacterium lividum]
HGGVAVPRRAVRTAFGNAPCPELFQESMAALQCLVVQLHCLRQCALP